MFAVEMPVCFIEVLGAMGNAEDFAKMFVSITSQNSQRVCIFV